MSDPISASHRQCRADVSNVRRSTFTVEVEVDEKIYLFSTLDRTFIRLAKSLDILLESSSPAVDRLLELGYLKSASLSVECEYENFFKAKLQGARHLNLLFTSNTTCNLACGYCFENRTRRIAMSDEIYIATLSWLESTIVSRKIHRLSINLFGGEPMLEFPRLTQFLTDLSRLEERYDLPKTSVQLTTNGLDSDDLRLSCLAELGVSEAQITIDGDRSTNDARRRRRVPANQLSPQVSVYNTVVNNLSSYTKYFPVTLKINFDKSTVGSVSKAINDVVGNPSIDRRQLSIKPEPIAIWKNYKNISDNSLYSRESADLADAFGEILKLSICNDIALDLSAIFPTPCMATSENSYLLEPNGVLRSCISAFGMEAFSVGNVFDASAPPASRAPFSTDLATPGVSACLSRECSYMPICDGGCRYETYLASGTLNAMSCGYSYFQAVIPHVLRSMLYNAWRIEEVGGCQP